MKALITGIGGFVGGYLSEYLLNQNINVYGTSLGSYNEKEKTVYKMDITDKNSVKIVLEEIKPDYIFHLAAQSSAAISWEKPQQTVNVNINGTINLLDCIRELRLNSKILLVGSSEEYGFIDENDMPINENQNLKPGNIYAVSKIAQDMVGQIYAKAYNMDIIIVRAFNHIGPKQSINFVVSDFAKRIVEIEKKIIPPVLLVGNLNAKRDFTDVRDIVRGYYEIIKKGQSGEIYNIGSSKVYSIEYILNYLISLVQIDIEIKEDSNRMRPLDIPVIQCDNTKFIKATSWKPFYKIEQTLNDVIDYWRKNI